MTEHPDRRVPASTPTLDIEFQVVPDDIHAVGRAVNRGRRSPLLVYAVLFGAVGVAFWILGNPVGAGLMLIFSLVVYLNPRIGPLDRWYAKRLPGNRIGSTWHFRFDANGIEFMSEGLTGHASWDTVRRVEAVGEAVLVFGSDNVLLATIPRRALDEPQLGAVLQLTKAYAPSAQVVA